MSDELRLLARPFPKAFIRENPSGGGSYVPHHVIGQRLLQVCGPYTFAVKEIVRGDVDGTPPNPSASSARAKAGTPNLTGCVVGVVCSLTLTIDGVPHTVDEVGDCEQPHNWKTDGQRMKDAISDALKRCAMRFGCGLHLWAQNDYFLYDRLTEQAQVNAVPEEVRAIIEPLSALGDGALKAKLLEQFVANFGELATFDMAQREDAVRWVDERINA